MMIVNKQHSLWMQIQKIEKTPGFFCIKNKTNGKSYYMAAQCIKNSCLSEFIKLDRNMHRCIELQKDFNNGDEIVMLIASKTKDVFEAEELMEKMNIPNKIYQN